MKKILFILLLLVIFNKAYSIETRIVYNIQNEIITNIDIKKQFKYLVALNNNLDDLDKETILNISKESIIREKIKKIEISKNFNEITINKEYLNNLLKNIYLRLNLKSIDEFKIYLMNYDLTLEDIKTKMTIEALWNELIIEKYSAQVVLYEDKIRNKISNNTNIKSKNYMLSEIIFEVENKKEIQKKYNEIINSIVEIGFENTASIYSFSESAKVGGDIGWVSENSLNSKVRDNIENLKINEISEPIILSTGILLLKIIDINISKVNIDLETEFKKIVSYERNRQLNQYSKIHYNKVKKNLDFDEK
jgi:peptidyl-prolyl cis-trans isomerase SurA|tara:strand:- start:1613 stop:2533 length:921 start_codon:yes stop_codon:yes gene_type:complete